MKTVLRCTLVFHSRTNSENIYTGSFSNSLVSTREVDIDRTTDILLLQETESSPKVKMSYENCSTQPNDSELQNGCKGNGQDEIPISPVEKVAAFSVVYGVLFLVAVIGK